MDNLEFDKFVINPILSNIRTELVNFERNEIDSNNTTTFDFIQEDKKNYYKYDTINNENYTVDTLEKYRIIRKNGLDPILQTKLNKDYAFAFPYMWDPYIGERSNKIDPYGSLYFDPCILGKHFYTNRLNKLWVNGMADSENGEQWAGYYDDGVGAGETFYIHSRHHHPEWYLFRLPIHDCYLVNGHDEQLITMGPKLNDKDISFIDEKLQDMKSRYAAMYNNYYPPSLVTIKKYYDIAINPGPHIENKNELSKNELMEAITRAQRKAVDKLKKMRG
jgi:hypothetical protein